ncbi:hypothetical protein [Companilactobacillus nodensis]|uniref:Phage protein n=1 Tax=Companilactobacillus nodensis DSM 19682 = JCM 14932 = NBRC 107160 TaxID=1423775 RepID=A0A0R1K5C2_9LACO|nr:hypothetical protein [Companilactobacillus nodensis]KRK78774.1 hypothetical protein FD03_GL002553 [Companilactobacillus nodensis DSM 19682 = JCM 14932 = NBRC 107160]
MDLTVDVINKLKEISDEASNNKVINIDGRNYCINGNGDVRLMLPKNLSEDSVQLNTLTGLIDIVKNMPERKNEKLYIQVTSPTMVDVYGGLDSYGRREQLVCSRAVLPRIDFYQFLDQEEMNITLQSKFVENPDREIILKVIGNLEEKTVHSANDDGVSQSVNIKTGVASVSEVKVPNPVTLAPYRTFAEVTQPASKFIFRMKNGMLTAIFEADGGAWKNEAMNSVATYLEDNFAEEVESKHVVVIS